MTSNNYLQAMATAYDQAKDDACITDPANPYQEQLDNRREFVHQQVTDAYGPVIDGDGDDLLNADVLDTILDAHDEWLTTHDRTPTRVPDPAIRREDALAMTLRHHRPTDAFDGATAVTHAAYLERYLSAGIVPTDEDELVDALYLVASELDRRDRQRGPAAVPDAWTATQLRDLAKEIDA
jgi:hypothetical protein